MDAAWEAGITTFDTADAYGGGRSETCDRQAGSAAARPTVRDRIVADARRPSTRWATAPTRGLAPRADPAPARRRASSGSASSGRPLPRARARPGHAARGDARRASTTLVAARARSAPIGAQQRRRGDWLEEALGSATARLAASSGCRTRYSLLDRDAETEVLPLVRRAGPRLHALQPARRRLADGQVPPRRGAARGLADDAAARAVRAIWRTVASTTRSSAFEASARERGPSPCRRSRSPGCSAIRRSTAVVVGPRGPEQLAPALEALELDLSAAERDELAELFA